jgi:hemoglobin
MKKERRYITIMLALAAAFMVSLWAAAPGIAGEKPKAKTASLYERLGGANHIAVFVNELIERSYKDKILSANPRIHEAHKRFPKAAYLFQATTMACQVFGGPYKYMGRTHEQAHRHLHITEKEWNRFMEIVQETLNDFKIKAKEQKEVLAIIAGTKKQCVFPQDNK